MSEPIWFALEGKVAGDVARDTKITVASINTCKNRQRGTRGRRINGGNANFQYSLTRRLSRRERETLRVRALSPDPALPPSLPEKKDSASK